MKKSLLTLALILASSNAFAVAQASYQCGPYTYEIFGAESSSLWNARGDELGRWESEVDTPTMFANGKLYLKWNNRVFRCRHLGTNH